MATAISSLPGRSEGHSPQCGLFNAPQCTVPCQVAELTLDGADTGPAVSSDTVQIDAPQQPGPPKQMFGGFLSELCRRIDKELASEKDAGAQALEHDYVCNLWQRFREVSDLPAFREAAKKRQASLPAAPARHFDVALEKAENGSFGFAVHRLEGHDNVLVVDEIRIGGCLDTWNRTMRKLGKTTFCVHPLAIIIQVNGFKAHCDDMTNELVKRRIQLTILNPPSVVAILAVYDLLKDGGKMDAPFWVSSVPTLRPGTAQDLAQTYPAAASTPSPATASSSTSTRRGPPVPKLDMRPAEQLKPPPLKSYNEGQGHGAPANALGNSLGCFSQAPPAPPQPSHPALQLNKGASDDPVLAAAIATTQAGDPRQQLPEFAAKSQEERPRDCHIWGNEKNRSCAVATEDCFNTETHQRQEPPRNLATCAVEKRGGV